MAKFALSICIPSYNMGKHLAELLSSIDLEYANEVQVVISDNASTDDTPDIVKSFSSKYGNVKYFRHRANQGPDLNFLKVVELADGEYCWLMGADDALCNNALYVMLNNIASKKTIYLVNRKKADSQLNLIREERWLKCTPATRDFTFLSSKVLIDYFGRAAKLGAVFSYLSSIIVRREAWMSISVDPRFIGTGYVHAAILLSIITNGESLRYIHDSLVLCRFGNDSFLVDGYAKRVQIDLEGYIFLAALLPREARWSFLQILKRERPWSRILKARIHSDDEQWVLLRQKFQYIGWQTSYLRLAEKLACATSVFLLLDRLRWRVTTAYAVFKGKRTLFRLPSMTNHNICKLICYEHLNAGHRPSYLKVFHEVLGGETACGHFWRRLKPLIVAEGALFSTCDDYFLKYILVGLLRAYGGKQTVGLSIRTELVIEGKAAKYTLKKILLRLLRLVPSIKTISIMPHWVEPRLTDIITDWIYDPQLWDLPIVFSNSDRTGPITKCEMRIIKHAEGRNVILLPGKISQAKGTEFFCNLLIQHPELADLYLFAAVGPIVDSSNALLNHFVDSGGLFVETKLSDIELLSLYRIAKLVWCCYYPTYNQASGIFGRALQFDVSTIVRKGSYLHKLQQHFGGGCALNYGDFDQSAVTLLAFRPNSKYSYNNLSKELGRTSMTRLKTFLHV